MKNVSQSALGESLREREKGILIINNNNNVMFHNTEIEINMVRSNLRNECARAIA